MKNREQIKFEIGAKQEKLEALFNEIANKHNKGVMGLYEFIAICRIAVDIDNDIKNIANPNFNNILQESESIIFKRDSEKERQYGPFNESMERAAKFASLMTLDKEFTAEDMYICMMALKFSRLAYNKKYDTFLDAIGYTAAFQDYLKTQSNG